MELEFGVSSACFYPDETEKAMTALGEYGCKTTELFFNSPSEIEDDFIDNLIKIKNKYDMNIVSVHPFFSFAESFFLFSSYVRRFYDILPLYEKFCKAAQRLGADILVIHGAKIPGSISDDEYCRRFSVLIETGKKYGVRVCHENVVHHRSESPDYLKMMRDKIGEDFKVVLDIKQAHRAGYTPDDFIDVLGDTIVHIHISDRDEQNDCITPLKGVFDFSHLFKKAEKIGYNGKYIIELYEWSYESRDEIFEAYRKLEEMNNLSL